MVKSNFKTLLLQHISLDPLEQFGTFSILIVQNPMLQGWTSFCPFNSFLYKALDTILYLFNIIYFILNIVCFKYVPTTIILVFMGLFVWYVLFVIVIHKEDTPFVNSSDFFSFTKGGSTVKRINLMRTAFSFLNNIALGKLKSNITLFRKEFFSVVLFLFVFILLINIFGLFPYTFTITTFIITFF
jgi:hypothetical protein